MRILDSTKSLSTLATDNTNGLGNIEPLECTVTEELNGIYECEFAVNTNDLHYADLKSSGLFKIPVNEGGDEQIFRVYEWGEEISQVAHIKAQHITYDLNKVTVKPFSATGASNVKTQILAHILGSYDFTMTTDITNTTSTFNLTIPRSFRECMGGYEGSLLDVFHGEYEYDNLTVKMLARRGADNGVRIAYGKNLTDFKQEQNLANVYDAVYGYAVVDEVTYEATSIYNKTGASKPKVLNVDFSDKYDTGEVPTGAELLAYATSYATSNDIEIPKVNINIEFVPLWQTAEYKNILPLERVNLGDTVHVYFDKLGVTASGRVIKTVWNVMTKKYDEIELGQARANLGTVISESVETAVNDSQGFLETELNNMSRLIANGLGLHITRDTQGRIYLHNADTLAGSQYQYEITSNGFMLSDDYGQTWSSGWDISGNAILNSLSTITLKALEIYGSYIDGSQILFGDHDNKYILAQVYNDGVNDIGVTFDGSGTVRFQPQDQFVINNLSSTNSLYNKLELKRQSSSNLLSFENYQYSNPSYVATQVQLYASASLNRFEIKNYLVGSNAKTNYIWLYTDTSEYNMDMYNGYISGEYMNRFTMQSSSSRNLSKLSNNNPSKVIANVVELYANSSSKISTISNYVYNSTNTANTIELKSTSSGNTVTMTNYDTSSTITNWIEMSSAQTNKIWSSNDLWLRSGGAVRIYANQDRTSATGDYQNNGYNSGTQDVYIGGYSLKLQCRSGGKIYLYWGSTRYYLGVSNGVVTATAA